VDSLHSSLEIGAARRPHQHLRHSRLGRMRRMTRKVVSTYNPRLARSLAMRNRTDGPAQAHSNTGQEAVESPPLFERVYGDHFQHVSRWARALGGMDADVDDLTQEVFMVVRRKLGTYSGPSMRAWLYGITRKTVSDYRRRAWVRRLLGGGTRSLDSERSQQLVAADPFERLEARRILHRVLDKLSGVRRTAFILFEIEGYSGEEIAELERIPLATVYTRLHHARKDFLRLVSELNPEEPTL
jgi:RNA polymerase sigma-70 factor, ECF subfamily